MVYATVYTCIMNDEKLISQLLEIKFSIIENAPDTLFMRGKGHETICEAIDEILIKHGVSGDDLALHYCQHANYGKADL